MAENEELEPLEDEIPEEEETEGEPEAEEGSEGDAPSEPEVDPEIEAEARKYGWKPKEEFTLEPKGWVDAERFLTMPKTQLKAAKDREREYQRQLEERDKRLSRMEGMTKTAIERVREQEKAQYEARLNEIERQKRAAAEVGDLDRYDALDRQQQGLKAPDPIDVPQAAPQQPAPDPGVAEYIEKAAWTKDPAAFRYGHELIEANPHIKALPPMKQVQWAEQQVKQHFPEHFPAEQPQRPTRSRVDGGGLAGGGTRSKGADHLPPEALKVAREFVSEGIFKSVDEYAKDYFGQE